MNLSRQEKINNFDIGQFIKDALGDQDINMRRLSNLTNIPYYKITNQVALIRDLKFREFLIIMDALNISPDLVLKQALGKTKNDQTKIFINNLNTEELLILQEIDNIPIEYRNVIFNIISNILKNFNVIISNK